MTQTEPFLAIFDDFDQPIKIPGWFNNLVSLGTALESWNEHKGKLVVVVTCPIARYATVAISLGITLSRLKKLELNSTTNAELVSKFAYGDLISIRAGDKQVIGKFFGLENENEIHIGPSRFKLQKVDEIHSVKAYSEIREKPHVLSTRRKGIISYISDPKEKNYSEANSHIVIVGDKLNVLNEFGLNIGIHGRVASKSVEYEPIADIVKVKGIREALGWSCEVLSRDEFLLTENDFTASHLLVSNNRNCSELSEYNFNKSKVLLLDSRDSLDSALSSIKAYSQYCRPIDPSDIGWKPDIAFRGMVMVEANV